LFFLAQPPPESLLPAKTPGWVKSLVGAGHWGLFALAYIDSSFGSLPILNDILLIALSIQNPDLMPTYAAMATLGSVLGCLTLYAVVYKGSEVVLHKKARPEQIERMRRWFEHNEFLTVAIPALLPPPTPFKLFVLAAGVFQARWQYFLVALLLGRGLRYFLWGFLAVRYREDTLNFLFYLRKHPWQVAGMALVLLLVGFLAIRLWDRWHTRRPAAASGA
jgi:membrane protein YqaA with SNARE-associated domain